MTNDTGGGAPCTVLAELHPVGARVRARISAGHPLAVFGGEWPVRGAA